MPTPESDDVRIGVPTAGERRPAPPPPAPAEPEPELREGETELGRPPQVPAEISELTQRERDMLRRMEEEEAERELAEVEHALISEPALLRLPRKIGNPLLAALIFGLGGVLGLFLFSQTLAILDSIAVQPLWLQVLGYALLVVLGGAVIYAIGRLSVFYFRMRRNQQIRMQGLEELSKRTKLRWLVRAKSQEAYDQMVRYLKEYPLDRPKDRAALIGVGLTEETLGELDKSRTELLDANRFSTTEEWFQRFAETFQAKLDEVAEVRLQYWAKRTGVVTALAPNGLVDSASTLYFSFTMIGDLCRLYNLRAGGTGTAMLLVQVFFNAYLAGQGTEIERVAEQSIEGMFSPHGVLYEMTAAKVVAKVGSKAASGALNYFLLRRLGRFSMRLLRPVTRN